MPTLAIQDGQILIYHLFTLADTVDLERLRREGGFSTAEARFTSRRPTPEYIQFRKLPLTFSLGDRMLHPAPDQAVKARVGAKIYDFGVLSLRWSVPCPPDWEGLLAEAPRYVDNPSLEVQSRQLLEELHPRLVPYLINPPAEILAEDYTIFYVERFSEAMEAEELLKLHAASLAQLIRGERKELAASERDEVLRQRVSYFRDDLAVIDWMAAFIYDREGGREHFDTLEFANAELLELRFYDRLLDAQLDTIYQDIERRSTRRPWQRALASDYGPTQRRLMAVTVDVIELTEQIENALKFIGDLYSARIYRAIAARLQLREWESSVDDKIRIAHQIYEMLADQLNTRRSMTLEVIVVVLIAFEILMALSRH